MTTDDMFAVGNPVTFRSYNGQIIDRRDLEEDGYRWTMLTLRMENGAIITLDQADVDESLAMRGMA
jgi:hypothetical protein